MTNQNFSFNALDSYFLNTFNNTLNIGYLRDQVYMQMDVVWRNEKGHISGKSLLHEVMINKRRTIKSVIWAAFMDFANDAIKQEYGENYIVTSYHLKNYLKKYGFTVEEALNPIIGEVQQMRLDCLADN